MSGLLIWPNLCLTQPCVDVPLKSDPEAEVAGLDSTEYQNLLDECAAKSRQLSGLGVAAPQIGFNRRFFVLTFPGQDPMPVINPEVVSMSGPLFEREEGCLSIPGAWIKVPRYEEVRARWFDRNGAGVEMILAGLQAWAFQHEMDHLNGKLIVEHMPSAKRNVLRQQLINYKNRNGNTR